MSMVVEKHLKTRCWCLCFKRHKEIAKLSPILATHLLQLVHLDYLTIDFGKWDQDINILVVMDHFARFAQTFVTLSQSAIFTAKTLWNKHIMHYDFPQKILSDQGRNFESKLIKHLVQSSSTQKLRSSPHHPQTNGQCKKFNSSLIYIFETLSKKGERNWKEMVSTLVHAYICTINSAAGFSPHSLMFGRQLMLAIDMMFNVRSPDSKQ